MSTIEIRNVRKSFGRTMVIHGIDVAIAAGELVVVVGPSGCGKSTLLRMIAGLEDVSDGEISIGGQLVNDLEPRERNVAMVFQNYALYPHMTVYQNMGYALRVAGRPKAEIRERVEEVAKILELDLLLERKPSQLSGGQRQRVAMGRAIIRKPAVFLFDEPLSNLDAKLRTQMRVEIKKLQRRLGVTSVFVTHDQVEAMTMADRLVVMNEGRIEQIGTSAEVYARPATAYVGGFIGSPPMNFFEGRLSANGNELVLANGSTFALAPGNRGSIDPRDVTVGIRPEHLQIVANGDHAIAGHVDLVEELGAARLLHVQDAGGSFIVQVPPSETIAIGDDVSLGVGSENLHLFDRDEGRRID